MAEDKKNITGLGWAFPPRFDKISKRAAIVTGEKDIIQSLQILFGTRPGERILSQQFGCNIEASLFNTMTLSEETLLKEEIKDAIVDYEPRIDVNQINIDTSQSLDGIIHIQIDFTIRNINSRHNIVYPFFIGEGTLIPKNIF